MFITLEEAKGYLRVDSSDEDDFILGLVSAADSLITDISRMNADELKQSETIVRTAYLYEHREEADHKAMTETVKYLLSSVRKEAF